MSHTNHPTGIRSATPNRVLNINELTQAEMPPSLDPSSVVLLDDRVILLFRSTIPWTIWNSLTCLGD